MGAWKAGMENLVYSTRLVVPITMLALRLSAFRNARNHQGYHYKRCILAIMRRTLREDSNAVDVGAHRGLYLFPVLGHAPRGRHIAIEPIPFLATQLRARFPGVDVHAVAVGDTSGSTRFFLDRREPGYSSMFSWKGHATRPEFVDEIEVTVRRLDEIVPPGRQIDFIKMDPMGAHVKVLKGALGLIQRCRPVIVIYLRNPAGGDPPEQSAPETWELLTGTCGMTISRLQDYVSGRPALSRTQFLASVGHHEGSEFCFVASPAEAAGYSPSVR